MDRLARIRREFVRRLQSRDALKSSALLEAFATVPRERFVGEGPWLVSDGDGYRETADADPVHLYEDVRVALDADRELNNGSPFRHAYWLERLGVKPGERVIHVGAGTGYYSAILAAVVGPSGSVSALEIDPELLVLLHRNTAAIPQIRVIGPEPLDAVPGSADRVYLCCALTRPCAWLTALAPNGSMIVPLTEMSSPRRHGGVFCIERRAGHGDRAQYLGAIRMYPCSTGREATDEASIAQAFERGGAERVRSLRSDAHARDEHCWLHAECCCLSERVPTHARGTPAP